MLTMGTSFIGATRLLVILYNNIYVEMLCYFLKYSYTYFNQPDIIVDICHHFLLAEIDGHSLRTQLCKGLFKYPAIA